MVFPPCICFTREKKEHAFLSFFFFFFFLSFFLCSFLFLFFLASMAGKSALLLCDFQPGILSFLGDKKGTLLEQGRRILEGARGSPATIGLIVHVAVRFRPGHPEVASSNKMFSRIKEAQALVEGTPPAMIEEMVSFLSPPPCPLYTLLPFTFHSFILSALNHPFPLPFFPSVLCFALLCLFPWLFFPFPLPALFLTLPFPCFLIPFTACPKRRRACGS